MFGLTILLNMLLRDLPDRWHTCQSPDLVSVALVAAPRSREPFTKEGVRHVSQGARNRCYSSVHSLNQRCAPGLEQQHAVRPGDWTGLCRGTRHRGALGSANPTTAAESVTPGIDAPWCALQGVSYKLTS